MTEAELSSDMHCFIKKNYMLDQVQKQKSLLGYKVLTVLFINTDFWEEMPCSPLDVHQCFRRTSCLHYGSTLMMETAAMK
jgi:hypothetical protein